VEEVFTDYEMDILNGIGYDDKRKLGCASPPHTPRDGFYGIFDRHDVNEGRRYNALTSKLRRQYPRQMSRVRGGVWTCKKRGVDIWDRFQRILRLFESGEYLCSMCQPGKVYVLRSVQPKSESVQAAVVQDEHTDLDAGEEVFEHEETPMSVIFPLEREGCHVWLRPESTQLEVHRHSRGKMPLIKVHIPYGGVCFFRGDTPHGGGVYGKENRRMHTEIKMEGYDGVVYNADVTYPIKQGKGFIEQERIHDLIPASEKYLSQMVSYMLGRKPERRR
jgi:hypothetical protein